MDKKQRRQIAEAFKAAKKHLWDGASPFRPFITRPGICGCLVVSRHKYEAKARDIIQDRLCGSMTVYSWLRSHSIPEKQLTNANVQAHRHAWLDMLIEEFSA